MHYMYLLPLFLIQVFFTSTTNAEIRRDIILRNGLDYQIKTLRETVEATYYHMLEQDHFPLTYNNNLVINAALDKYGLDVQKEATVLMHLIEWLSKQTDRNSVFLLRKINELFFLEFHSYIAALDLKNKSCAELLMHCQELFHFNVVLDESTPYAPYYYPFRTTLTKLFLIMTIINNSQMKYEERKETFLFALDELKLELIYTNKWLAQKAIDQNKITAFITFIASFGVKEPFIRPQYIRKMVIFAIATVALGAFIYFWVMPNKGKIMNKLSEWSYDIRDNVVKPIGQGLGESIINAMVEPAYEMNMFEQDPNSLSGVCWTAIDQVPEALRGRPVEDHRALAYYRRAAQGVGNQVPLRLNPDLDHAIQQTVSTALQGVNTNIAQNRIGVTLADQIIEGIARGNNPPVAGQPPAPNPNLVLAGNAIGESVGHGAIHGIARGGAPAPAEGQRPAPNPDLQVISHEIIRGIARGDASAPGQPQPANPDLHVIGHQISNGATVGAADATASLPGRAASGARSWLHNWWTGQPAPQPGAVPPPANPPAQ